MTPQGRLEYHANDMSIGDVDGDSEYEYIVNEILPIPTMFPLRDIRENAIWTV